MPISSSCPISPGKRDETVTRLVAGLVAVAALASFAAAMWGSGAAKAWLPAAILAVTAADAAVRGLFQPKASPFAALARAAQSGLGLPTRLVAEAPKVFAARLCLLEAGVGAVGFVIGLELLGLVMAGSLAVFALADAVAGFCAACWLHPLLPPRLAEALTRPLGRRGATVAG
jgi:hypothetical protein